MLIFYLDNDAAFIIANGHIVGSLLTSNGPYSLKSVVQCALQPIGVGMPNTHCAYGVKTA